MLGTGSKLANGEGGSGPERRASVGKGIGSSCAGSVLEGKGRLREWLTGLASGSDADGVVGRRWVTVRWSGR